MTLAPVEDTRRAAEDRGQDNKSLSEELSNLRRKNLIKKILRFLFSHVGLCFLNIAYLSIGASIFIVLEEYQDADVDASRMAQLNASQRVDAERQNLINRLIANVRSSKMSEKVVLDWVNNYHNIVISEKTNNNYQGFVSVADVTPSNKWSFSSVMLFVLSIASTIGYGHITPQDDAGYFMVFAYGLFGIPFFVMSLGSIGSGLAALLKTGYHRGCCWAITRRRQRNQEEMRPMTMTSLNDGNNFDEQDQDDGVPLTLALTTVAFYVCFGGILFAYKESWSIVESFYFCVVTLMTIGFGDRVPGWSASKNVTGQLSIAVAFLYIVVGLALVSMTLNVAVHLLRRHVIIAMSKVKIWKDEHDEQ